MVQLDTGVPPNFSRGAMWGASLAERDFERDFERETRAHTLEFFTIKRLTQVVSGPNSSTRLHNLVCCVGCPCPFGS